MSKVPQPRPSDKWLCKHLERGREFSQGCACWQGWDGKGEWRVYVDRNGVAYTAWESWKEIPF